MSASPSKPLRARRSAWLFAAVAAVIAVSGIATLAVAKTSKKPAPLVKTARNTTLKQTILVDANGRTLYELRPETTKHLLCTSSACFGFWPPAKVGAKTKLAKGTGVKGRLGRLHRKSFDQLMLDGRPLYRFSGDSHKGMATGNGFQTFGGTWHVVPQSRSTKSSQTTTTTTTTSTSSAYSYPGY